MKVVSIVFCNGGKSVFELWNNQFSSVFTVGVVVGFSAPPFPPGGRSAQEKKADFI